TVIELASIEDRPPKDDQVLVELKDADPTASAPSITPVNSASFTQATRSGRVAMGIVASPPGELVVTRLTYENGLVTESRSLVDQNASPPTLYLEDLSYMGGTVVRRHLMYFRKKAFPEDPDKDLPRDLYGGDMTLGVILPRLLPDDRE